MAISAKELGIDKLSIDDRLALVEEIWESIWEEEPEMPLPAQRETELRLKLEEFENHPAQGIAWQENEALTQPALPQ